MNDQLVLALDVGGSSVKSALVTNRHQIVGPVDVDEIQSGASAPEILTRLAAIISGHLENASDLCGIAFAFPGPFDYVQGISLIHNQAKYEALDELCLGRELKKIRIPVPLRTSARMMYSPHAVYWRACANAASM